MKKYLFLTLGMLVSIAVFSQEKESQKKTAVPQAVKDAFAKKYPGVNAKWEKEDGNYEGNFKDGSQEASVLYDAKGNLVELEIEMKVADLPASALEYLKAHYKNQTAKGAAKITKANGEINYEAELKGKDVMFDSNGKYLKEVKD